MKLGVVVIGSGPAGAAASWALRGRGVGVTMLDAGVRLEPERRARVDELARADPGDWPEASVAQLHGAERATLRGAPRKLIYGSDFPYRETAHWLPFETRNCDTCPTLARGGFSTVWGAACLPYLAEDLADWPVSAEDLAPHYRAVTDFVPLAARRDDLADELPLYAREPRPLNPSRQMRELMADLERARERLGGRGLRFGWSRLAVRADPRGDLRGCAYCGLCLVGCPYGLIYESSTTLDQLEREGGFRYRGGVVVDRLVEGGGSVTIHARSLEGGSALRFEAERVLVACGVVSTTRLLFASLGITDRPVDILDSQYFLLPLLRYAGAGRPREEELHTLSQIFLELRDPAVATRNVHLQVYGYNSHFQQVVERMLGPLGRPARPLLDPLLSRLLLIMGFLHSEDSSRIAATLRRDGRLVLEGRRNPATRRTLRRVVGRLRDHAGDLRARPLGPLLRIAPLGRGYHSGGSFPMRKSPGELECDLLGRPTGFRRVHVVDATTFPTIPATTITLSVMANAHRIASAIAES